MMGGAFRPGPVMKQVARAILKRAVATATRHAGLRRMILFGHARWHARDGANRVHPFDRRMGIAAGGCIPGCLLTSGSDADAGNTAYLGSPPDSVRQVLSVIANPADWAFIDVGCGMGRALAVASEFAFRSVTGIELSPDLVRVARANAAIIASRHPSRSGIVVEQGDASRPHLTGPTVLMLYHPFGAVLMQRLVRTLQAAIDAGYAVIVVYLNPVHGGQLDASPGFARLYAETVTHSPQDRAHAVDDDVAIVAWQAGLVSQPPQPGCDRPIVIAKPDWQARLATW